MNKILVEKDNIQNINNSNFSIKDNVITFKKSGEYYIEYINCKKTNIIFNIEENIMIKLIEYAENLDINIDNIYNLNKYSNLLLFKFYNNKKVTEKIILNLNEQYSKVDYHFSNICSANENYNIVINHNASFTDSYICNKSVTTKDANLSFTIDSILPKGNKKCNLNQETRIITDEDSYGKIEPNMYIEEDDVTAKHGSVIGTFNKDEVFYLMARGIPERDALKLLIQGLIYSNIIVSDEIKARIFNIINEKWRWKYE